MYHNHLLSRCQMFLLPLLPPIVLNIYTECLDPCCQPMVPTLLWSPCLSMAFMPNHWPLPNSLDFVVFRYVCEHIFVLILHAWQFGARPKVLRNILLMYKLCTYIRNTFSWHSDHLKSIDFTKIFYMKFLIFSQIFEIVEKN